MGDFMKSNSGIYEFFKSIKSEKKLTYKQMANKVGVLPSFIFSQFILL